MKKYKINKRLMLICIFIIGIFVRCQKDNEKPRNFDFNFPEITSIDSSVYNEIKKTCEAYWDLSNMIDTTFEIREDMGGEYVVQCEGYEDSLLYIFVIRVDKDGKWINDGRVLKIENAEQPENKYGYENWPGKNGNVKTNIEFPDNLVSKYHMSLASGQKEPISFIKFRFMKTIL